VKAFLCSFLVMLILVTIPRPVGVATASVANAPEDAFELRWKLVVEDLTSSEIVSFNLETSLDGSRTLIGYLSADERFAIVVDEDGKRILTGPASTYPVLSALSSDGRVLVVSIERGEEENATLAWYDVDTRQQIRNASLGKGSTVHSLAISDDASMVAVSGVVWSNYTFIHAFDSQGRRLWSHVSAARELVGYHEYSYQLSTVAVSGNGKYVAAAIRDMTVRFWGVCGGKNGVVLFNRAGEAVWNYSEQE
jgi:WD40 repeat protein